MIKIAKMKIVVKTRTKANIECNKKVLKMMTMMTRRSTKTAVKVSKIKIDVKMRKMKKVVNLPSLTS